MTARKRKNLISKPNIYKNNNNDIKNIIVKKEESDSDSDSGSSYESFYGFGDYEKEEEEDKEEDKEEEDEDEDEDEEEDEEDEEEDEEDEEKEEEEEEEEEDELLSTDTDAGPTTTRRATKIKDPSKLVEDDSNNEDMNGENKKQRIKMGYRPRPTNRKSPWVLFCSEYRSRIVEENPELAGYESQQKLAELYYNLPESEKERYRQEYEVYKEKVNNIRQIRPRNQKVPGNGYIQYTKFITPQINKLHPEYSLSERNRLVALGWKNLGEEGRRKYIDEAKILLEDFIRENPEYYAIHLKRSLAKRRATLNARQNKKKKMQ
ncbi:hypothetical protein BDC45DRAFT_606462 [Circinella umbellata]|nr:hypothetical protein BDC45DRAFT_606462 [Circinella umbellata]